MPTQYDPMGLLASVVIATLASYVALDLARRVHATRGRASVLWWTFGAGVMGTGIWAMHFLGMQAFVLPIQLGYNYKFTLLSWVAGVVASAVALGVAGRMTYRPRNLIRGSIAMAIGISSMHYIGMAALDMTPSIQWDFPLVGLSVLIAVIASAAALFLFHRLLKVATNRRVPAQFGAAVVLSAGICGLHYVGMAGAQFPMDSFCLSADRLGGAALTVVVLLVSVTLLVSTLLLSMLDARLQSTAERLTASLVKANTQLKSANAELQERAFTDPLTGLPNRLLFEDRLNQALSRADRLNRDKERVEARLAVLFIDLDGFKPINDSFGHATGDLILTEVASRLRNQARENDTVARVGGDEFLMLLEDVPSAAGCALVARKIIGVLAGAFSVADRNIKISCSVGIVLYPETGQREKLIANADAAMYAAKRAGGSNYAMFEPSMGADANTQLELLSDLRTALELGQFSLHYQPKVSGASNRIHGVEALLRWTHPVRGNVPPDEFIGMAERFGLIGQIGNWVIEEACRQMSEWREQGLRMRVAVNLSVHQLRENNLAERVQAALERYHIDSSQLLCEITESVAMEDMHITRRAFEALAQIGVYLAIDDFGTGYSSLSYLRQLPAQQLKIDRSFVKDLESSSDARAVVEAVIQLAHALSLLVVAEGVETEGQRDILLGMQCDELQGYYFARPMTPGTLLEWSRGQKPEHAADFAHSTTA
ncbi:putative bifunctional diguanylate cyclase/phosphodiesterase [Xylophilus sp. GOD-11R]|uniref:putative bifunctional diguanylate cyclase/phosphodiesterase n=1 Tax=Xylophilus sp. GOD-11R TaxID=3089814 RepID=UPI00298C24E6|nr:EAL domain-containing protein [Xylophilus sp. GOD-11R]WPB59124.1 EAL domain-containing protein [Xylophilus sp. GOD-11R]